MSKKLNTLLIDTWYDAYELIRKFPRILFPLSIVAFLEGLWLELLYFAPRPPLKEFLFPPIKRFFGEAILHYPAFLFLLPRLFGYGQILIYIFIGGILTSVAIVMAASASENRPLRFSEAFKRVKKRIFSLILASFLIVILLGIVTGREVALFKMGFDFVGKGPLLKILQILWRVTPYLNFFIAIAIQAFVAFVFPYLVVDNKKFFPAVGKSFVLGGRHFKHVFLLLLLPMFCYGPLWVLKGNPAFLVKQTLYPEVIGWILGVGIAATVLVDTFVAVSVTLFFLRVRNEKSS